MKEKLRSEKNFSPFCAPHGIGFAVLLSFGQCYCYAVLLFFGQFYCSAVMLTDLFSLKSLYAEYENRVINSSQSNMNIL